MAEEEVKTDAAPDVDEKSPFDSGGPGTNTLFKDSGPILTDDEGAGSDDDFVDPLSGDYPDEQDAEIAKALGVTLPGSDEDPKSETTEQSKTEATGDDNEPSMDYSLEQKQLARSMGFTRETLEGMTPEAFDHVATLLNYALQQSQPQAAGDAQSTDDGQLQQPAGQPESPAFDIESRLDGYDDETADLLRDMYTSQQAEVNSLREQYGQQFEESQEAVQEAAEQQFDALLSDLDPAYEAILGKGPTKGLDPLSDPAIVRQELLQEMRAYQMGREAAGQPYLPFGELFSKAIGSVLVEKNQEIDRRKLASQVKGRSGQKVGRPNARKKVGVGPSDDKALQAVELYCRENGIPFEQPADDAYTYEGF